MKRIAVLLVEDHQLVREGVRSLLELEPDIEVIGEAENGRQAVQLTGRFHPDVVVMDIGMPLLNGLEATRQIRKNFPDTQVLILSAHDDDTYFRKAAALGASGFLSKATGLQGLIAAIHAVQETSKTRSAAPSPLLNDRDQESPAQAGNLEKRNANYLSSREVEVLQLIAEGMPNKQISSELGMSLKTVDKHRQHLMQKLNIHNIAGLTCYAVAAGIVENTSKPDSDYRARPDCLKEAGNRWRSVKLTASDAFWRPTEMSETA